MAQPRPHGTTRACLVGDPQRAITPIVHRFLPSLCQSLFGNHRHMWAGLVGRLATMLFMVGLSGPVVFGAVSSAPKTDREEAGLLGNVQTVILKEAFLVETDHYDAAGRLVRRIEETAEHQDLLGALSYVSIHDANGRRIMESIQDAKNMVIKQTAYSYEDRGYRTAEISVWADGAFENASFYDYDGEGHRIRGLHFNTHDLVNRNSFQYDAQGRVLREVYSRNYTYARRSERPARLPKFEDGYEVAIQYDDRGLIREKVVSNLKRVRLSRSEFEYDDRGSQIEERIYDTKNVLMERKRYAYEYDSQGNWIVESLEWWEFRKGIPQLKRSQSRERAITYFK